MKSRYVIGVCFLVICGILILVRIFRIIILGAEPVSWITSAIAVSFVIGFIFFIIGSKR